ncbi:MAG: aminofutalosine synthase MqnE [Planctomycetes bacterium]|nr:aminofutalosine synthase MqnE [Planctomycetota bacterium]
MPDLIVRRARQAGLADIAERALSGRRLDAEDGARLFAAEDLAVVAALADALRRRRHGDRAYFNVNMHLNYTNICRSRCRFCAFHRQPAEQGAYCLTPEQAADEVKKRLADPVTEVHMVGGVNPALPYGYYLDLLRAVKAARPGLHLKAFTMVEIDEIVRLAERPAAAVFADLKEAGLDSLPGGGAEVFAERVHRELFPRKIGAARWLELARTAHDAGLKTNCTMLYGHIETHEERVDHLLRLRALQDETGGFQAFVPLAFHPEHTGLSHLQAPTAHDDLRTIAVARLLLDNIPHVKAYWVMLGIPVAQMALSSGADDIDGTVTEERISHDAGATTPRSLSRAELVRLIADAGFQAVERDTLYRVVRVEEQPA